MYKAQKILGDDENGWMTDAQAHTNDGWIVWVCPKCLFGLYSKKCQCYVIWWQSASFRVFPSAI